MKKLFSHVLLVDDDTITNYINENLLEDMRIADNIHVTDDGQKALSFIRKYWLQEESMSVQQMPKLLLLDINMKQMDGFELLDRLDELPAIQNLCVVILTASILERERDKADKFKVNAFLEKPLTRTKLEEIAGTLKQCAES